MNARAIPLAVALLWIGAAANLGLSERLSVFGAHPDFLLCTLGVMALYLSQRGAMILGFFTGATFGALAGSGLSAFIASRMVASLVPGIATAVDLERNALTAAISAFLVTLIARLVLLFLLPPPSILSFLGATIRTSVFDAVLALPMWLLIHPLLEPAAKRK